MAVAEQLTDLSPAAYAPYRDPREDITSWTDRLWIKGALGQIHDHYAPDVKVHTCYGETYDLKNVIGNSIQRMVAFPNRGGGHDDVAWESRGKNAFVSAHKVFNNATHSGPWTYGPATNRDWVNRSMAHCLVRDNKVVEEWIVRDEFAVLQGLGMDAVLSAVPRMGSHAQVCAEQVTNLPSQEIDNAILLQLARRINALSASADVDGIVVTHGTDTMEETAYFLNLVVQTAKPVVVVGAMRPSTALSADGPLNLLNAVKVAASPKATGKGVLMVLDDRIGAARHTVFDLARIEALPTVDIVYGYQAAGCHRVDAELGTVAANSLNPQKARILLSLALTLGNDPRQVQTFFDRY